MRLIFTVIVVLVVGCTEKPKAAEVFKPQLDALSSAKNAEQAAKDAAEQQQKRIDAEAQ